MRTSLIVAALFLCAPALAQGQAVPDSIHQRNECRFAAQIVTSGQPAQDRAWAMSYVTHCGAEGGDALAERIRALRTSGDTALLNEVGQHARWLHDAALFAAFLDVAGDGSASVPARVFAFRNLIWLSNPNYPIAYDDLTAGVDSVGYPLSSCHAAQLTSSVGHYDGRPLPPDFAAQVRDRGWAVARDKSAPAVVRSAATCAAIL